MASEQEIPNAPVKKTMREKAIERRSANKEHNSNFRAGYVPIEEERLHKTGLRGRKGIIAIGIIILLFLLALINLIITLVIWTVIRIGPGGCESMEFHESGLLRFKQKADMGVVHPLHKSTVGGRKDQDLVITGNNNPVVFRQGNTKLSVEEDKTSIVSDLGISFTDPRTQTTFFSTDFENHEFHLPKEVKVLNVKKASTERITSNASSDLTIKGDGKAIIRGNEGVYIMGKTVEFSMGGGIELKAENSIILNGSVMFSPSRIPNSSLGGDLYFDEGLEREVGAKVKEFLSRSQCFVGNYPELQTEDCLSLVENCYPKRADYNVSVQLSAWCGSVAPPPLGDMFFPHLRLSCSLPVPAWSSPELLVFGFGHVKLKGLLHLWVGSNALESLSLILKKDRSGTRTLSSAHQECTSWAPDLQLLSAERNHLKHLPKGLGCMKSLQILQLSYNQISEIGHTDLDNCIHLKELHLQHNSITSIHPHAFKDLKHLQVLDLSYNLLVTLPVPAYQSLRNLNTLVDVSFNRWKCDCNLQTLRRWISFDTEMGDASWQVVCASPQHHAGKDLLHLKDSELTCPTHEYSTSGRYHNMIVDEGMQISIPCSNDSQDIMQVHWWTPHGQVKNNQPELLIKDITEQHAGLYVCVSGVQGEHISVFDLHVYKKGSGSRLRREAETILDEQENKKTPRNNPAVRQTVTQSNFALAVSLSVIITFIVAFILGVLLRPLLDKLCRRIRSKRRSTPPTTTTTTSSTGPQPYVNEGYHDVEDQEQEVRVGSRVTFGGITEVENHEPYYVTVENDQADGSSESNTEVEAANETIKKNKSSVTGGKRQTLERETHRGRADSSSSSSSSLQEREVNALVINGKANSMAKSMEFEPIPDPNDITQLKRRGSSSTSSQSSQEGNFSREPEQSVDPPAVTIPGNKNTMGRIPGFTTDPFSERSTRLTELNVDELDPELWNDSGESFSFNEGSERSSIRDNSALGHPLKDDDKWRQSKLESPSGKINLDSEVGDFDKPFGKELLVDDVKRLERSNTVSSSSSSESGESVVGPKNDVVNPELMDESDTENHANLGTLNRFGTLEDVTLNERMPSANILIRQEAVTHGDSTDESMHIYDSPRKSEDVNISDKLGICVDVGLDRMPKVKRYVEFKQFEPHSGSSTLPSFSHSLNNNTSSDMITLPSSPSLNTKVAILETRRYSSSSDDGELTTEEDNFFRKIGASSDGVSKVKRFITFKQFEPPSSSLPPFISKKEEMLEVKSYSSSSDDDDDDDNNDDDDHLTINGDNASSDGFSKVKRYISFTQLESSSPSLSVSTPSTKIEMTTEETIQSVQPSTSPEDTSQNVKKYMYLTQHQQHSSSMPSSPTSNRKFLPGKKTKHKKQHDQDSVPLYHVHPVYRSNINRLNRGYDTDRSYSSEEEDDISEYPIEFTMAPGINTGSITPDRKADKVLNIDFDNSSSSTDVYEKKHLKGLLGLRALSARLFNRQENETHEGNLPDVGRTTGVSSNRKPKVSDNLFENGLSFDHLPSVKRYLQFSHSDSYPQVQLPSPPPSTGVVMPEFIAATGSRRSSSSSEDDVQLRSPPPTTGVLVPGFITTTESRRSSSSSEDDVQLRSPPPTTGVLVPGFITTTEPRRSSSSSEDDVQLRSPPPTTGVIAPEFIATTEFRRSSSSSEDDVKGTTEDTNLAGQVGASYDRLPKVKRYIQFSSTEPCLTTLPLNKELVAKPESRRSSTSSEDDIKLTTNKDSFFGKIGVSVNTVPNVKRYIQFSQPKLYSPTLTSPPISTKRPVVSQPEATIDRSSGHLTQIEAFPVNIQKVKRYIRFKQSEPHSPTLPSPPPSNMKDAVQETRRYSSSSDDDELTTKEDNFFKKIGVSSVGVSKVKRFITFQQFEPSSPTLPGSRPTSTKIEATAKTEAVTSRLTSTSKDVRSQNENEEIGISLDRVPQVKRYIQFKQPVPHLPVVSPTTSEKLQVTPEVKAKSEARRSSSSSDDEPTQIKPTAKADNVFGQTETSLDRVPRVRRYIQFKHPDIQSPPQTTIGITSETINVTTVAKETRRWSTSSEEDVKLTTKKENITKETSEYLTKTPKVKRYIKFTQPEPYTSNLSPFRPLSTEKSIKETETKLKQPATRDSTSSEVQIGVSLNRVPKVKRYIQFIHPESQSPAQSTSPVSAQKLGVLGVVQDTRRSSSSSEEDVTLTAKKDNVFGDTEASLDKIPQVKRYIQFTKPANEPLVQTTALSAKKLGISGVVHETRKSSTSSDDDIEPSTHDDVFKQRGESFDKIPKVKRYIKFTQPEPFPLPSTVTSVKVTKTGPSTLAENYAQPSPKVNAKEDNVVGQTEAHLDRIPRVKRYIQFAQRSPERSTTSLSAERVGISKVILETRRSSSSSEEEVTLTAKEDSLGGHIGAPLNKIPKVKRYIHFTHPESQSPVQTTTALTAERVNMSVVAKETRRQSSSSEDDDDKPSNETGESVDKIQKVKRYIEFRQNEPYSSKFQSSSVVKPIKVTTTELRGTSTSVEDYVQPATIGNKTESMTQIASSESPERVSRVKRYIQFTPIESQYPSRASTAVLNERVQETKLSSNSAEYVKPTSTNYTVTGKTDKNLFQETSVSLDKIPKVKRYVAFTKSEPSSSTKLMNRDLTLTTQWSGLSSEVSPPASMKKGSALIIKTQSELWKSEFSSMEQTGLKSKLRKSSSSSSDESVDVPAPQDEPPALPLTSPPPLEQAREYLRENSEVRQRQERRRLLQQKKKEMDEFNIASLSSMQVGDKQDRSPAGYGGVTPFQTEHTYSNVSTSNTLTSKSTEGAEAPVLRGLKTKSTSAHGSNSTPHKYREYLI
ncbi:hypothetical protein QQF64_016903 [Cirrhinus molitorella]|uniref:Beta-sarcoglycan n=1 Tax=Cirrhinus molitorella TaxID=172907 RepID=A0ABR3LP34_9TELE